MYNTNKNNKHLNNKTQGRPNNERGAAKAMSYYSAPLTYTVKFDYEGVKAENYIVMVAKRSKAIFIYKDKKYLRIMFTAIFFLQSDWCKLIT